MDLRRRNGSVIRHDLLFRKADMVFRKAFATTTLSAIIRISCMRASS
jgi:hypothetical protein